VGWVLNKAGAKRELLHVIKASILWSYHEETRELPGERDNARNNASCTQMRKTMYGLDGQHQDMDRTAVEESVRMTEDRDKWRKYRAKEQIIISFTFPFYSL